MNQLLKDQKGFSLLEILIALAIAAGLYGTLIVNISNPRRNINEGLNNMERAIRFSGSEAALRNTLIRLQIKLGNDENPNQSYSLQYGPEGSFVLPKIRMGKNLSESEREEEELKAKKLDRKFNKIEEFQEEEKELSGYTRFIGIGTADYDQLITEGNASLFTYPTGEKDSAIIILGNDIEVAFVEINPFIQEFRREYRPLELQENTEEEIYDKQRDLADEIFLEWKSKK